MDKKKNARETIWIRMLMGRVQLGIHLYLGDLGLTGDLSRDWDEFSTKA